MTTQNKRSGSLLFTSRYDLAGNSIVRIFRHQLMARIVPMGNYRGGAGIKCMLAFILLHYFGGPLFCLLIRFEKQVEVLYKIRERFKKRGIGSDTGFKAR